MRNEREAAPSAELLIAKSLIELVESSGFSHSYSEASDSFTIHYKAGLLPTTFGKSASISKAAGDIGSNAPDFQPTKDEMEKILSFANRKNYRPEDFKVYQTISAGSAVDRHFEHFGTKALKSMARMSPGSPVMKDHNYYNSDGVIGKIFDAQIKKIDGQTVLVHKIYVFNSPENKSVIDGFENGTNDKLSVGVSVRRKDYICDQCDRPVFKSYAESKNWDDMWCGHYAGMELDDGSIATATIADVSDYRELSRVTVPAQPIAQVKAATAAGFEKAMRAEFNNKTRLAAVKAEGEDAMDEKKIIELFKGLEEKLDSKLDLQNRILKEQNDLLKQELSEKAKTDSKAVSLQRTKEALFEKQIAENKEFINVLAEAHKHLVSQIRTPKSVEVDAKDGNVFFKNFADGFRVGIPKPPQM